MVQTDIPAVREATSSLPDDIRVQLEHIVGAENLSLRFVDRLAYSRDRLPFSTYALRKGRLPATLPSAVVRPGDERELSELLRLASTRRLAVVPYGAGSGVLGAALPVCGEVMLDLKRLDWSPEIDEENHMVRVGAGMNGGVLEEFLNARGYTCGHHPQSLHMSTVGGWIACRGAGQMSSRYGKIENMVLGLRAVLPDGRGFAIKPVSRRAVGPGLLDLIVGSEGTLAVVTEATLKIWPLPAYRAPMVVAFPDLQAGLDAMRRIMQAEIRPSVARLYDDHESREKAHESADLTRNPVMCVLECAGVEELARTEAEMVRRICGDYGAEFLGLESFDKWKAARFKSYSAAFHAEGGYVETIEVTGLWSRLPALYSDIRAAVRALDPTISFGAHWSHVYAEGACQYMTFRIPAMDDDTALALHAQLWRIVQELTLKHQGSIAHHHGVGIFRNPWIEKELDGAMALFQAIKDAIDPGNILNPGKVGLTPRPGSVMPISKD